MRTHLLRGISGHMWTHYQMDQEIARYNKMCNAPFHACPSSTNLFMHQGKLILMYGIMQHDRRAPMPMQMTITSFGPHVVPNGGEGVAVNCPTTAMGNGVIDCICVLAARVEVSWDPEVLESKLENAMPTNVGSLVNSAVILMPERS